MDLRFTWDRSLLALIFAVSAMSKALSFEELRVTLGQSMLIPSGMEVYAAIALIFVELGISVTLLGFGSRAWPYLGSASLASLFFGYSLWRWFQDIQVPCHCFGLLFKLAPWQSGILSVALTTMGLFAASKRHPGIAFENRPSGQLGQGV